MNPYATRLLWGVGIVVTIAVVAAWQCGCGPTKEANEPTVDIALAVACSEVMNQAVDQAKTCQEAERKINASAVCRELKPDGFTLACRDGGT